MKHLAKTLLVVSLATATGAAFADTPWPSSARDEIPLAIEFPGMPTYSDSHLGDAARQSSVAYPSAAASGTSGFPSSGDETSLVDEGLYPELTGGANARAGAGQPTHN